MPSPMRLAFVVGDVKSQRPRYATAWLAHAALRRGHDVGFVGVDDLTLVADTRVWGRVVRPALPPGSKLDDTAALCASLATTGTSRDEPLHDWDAIFLRYNPGRERLALGNPAIDFGWRLRQGGVLVVNDPEGTQRAGARMYLSGLPAEIRPRTLISREPARLKAFLKALDAPAVVKPLAGETDDVDDVFYVARGQVKNLNQILSVVRKTGYVVVQEYLPAVTQGEKRLLLLAGAPIHAGGRVAIYKRIVGSDGRVERRRCELGAAEQRIVDVLGPKLRADGLYLVAVDIVGGKVLEVNVFTPGGIRANHELYGIDVGEVVVQDLERRVEQRRAA